MVCAHTHTQKEFHATRDKKQRTYKQAKITQTYKKNSKFAAEYDFQLFKICTTSEHFLLTDLTNYCDFILSYEMLFYLMDSNSIPCLKS